MTVLHIEWLLYYSRCLFSVLEMDSRYKWWVTSPNTHCSLLLINHFYAYNVLTRITWKLQVVCKCSAYRTTGILSETFFVCFNIALQIRLESYGPRHVSVVLWYHIVCVYILLAHVKRYCSNGIGRVWNGILYLGYGSSFKINTVKKWKTLIDENL